MAEALELADDEWIVSFQSRVGRAEWLRPYTDETIEELGKAGLERLDVVCPAFSVDCLETLEEIKLENGELFVESGGGELSYIPCLHARDDHVEFLTGLIERHAGGLPEAASDWQDDADEREKSKERALALGARQ